MKALEGVNVVCENISFVTTEESEDLTYKPKRILDGVNLCALPSELFAIMGPSGSGKTSLLNIMAGRTVKSLVDSGAFSEADLNSKKQRAPIPSGQIFFNGIKMDYPGVKSHSRYVMQSDCLLPFLTVHETIMFGAKLKLTSLTSAEQRARVDSLIAELGLESCRDVLIGNQIKKGVSGGQKKRVAIALELLAEPQLIYLDEPTSGLDSSLAFDVVKCLQRLARNGRTIIGTFHQPRSQIFSLFDKLMLLSMGRVVYHGPASEAAAFTASIDRPVPSNFNAADYFLDLLTVTYSPQEEATPVEELSPRPTAAAEPSSSKHSLSDQIGSDLSSADIEILQSGHFAGDDFVVYSKDTVIRKGSFVREVLSYEEVMRIPDQFEASTWGAQLHADVKKHSVRQMSLRKAVVPRKRERVGAWFQNTGTLTHRTMVNKFRDPASMIIGLSVVSLMTIITGLIYYKTDPPEEHPGSCLHYFNFVGVVAFSGINNSFSAMQAVMDFPERRPQYNREVAGGLYHPSAYFMGMQIGDFPFTMLYPLLHALIIYWMVNFGSTVGDFIYYLLMVCLIAFAATSWAQIGAMGSKSAAMASAIVPVGVVMAALLSGLWITESSLQHPWKDLKYFSWIRWGVNGFLKYRFAGNDIVDECAPLPSRPGAWESLACCAAFGVFARFISYLFLRYTNTRIGIEV